jgi:hypothetical protein
VGYAWYADHRRWGTRELASVLRLPAAMDDAGAGAGKPDRRDALVMVIDNTE